MKPSTASVGRDFKTALPQLSDCLRSPSLWSFSWNQVSTLFISLSLKPRCLELQKISENPFRLSPSMLNCPMVMQFVGAAPICAQSGGRPASIRNESRSCKKSVNQRWRWRWRWRRMGDSQSASRVSKRVTSKQQPPVYQTSKGTAFNFKHAEKHQTILFRTIFSAYNLHSLLRPYLLYLSLYLCSSPSPLSVCIPTSSWIII